MSTLRRGTSLLLAAAGLLLLAAVVAMLSSSTIGSALAQRGDEGTNRPMIYGHRGAAGYRPEHTLASYRTAARIGADYIEPDLVSTKDHVLVARHEPAIGATTDVSDHPEFAGRRTTKTIDGVTFADDWFTEDFTLAELKTLRAKERLPDLRQRNTIYNGRYTIPTFQEVIELRDRLSGELHRNVGLVPELKHSTYFRSIGLPLEEPFVQTLRRNHIADRDGKVTVQSFEIGNLERSATKNVSSARVSWKTPRWYWAFRLAGDHSPPMADTFRTPQPRARRGLWLQRSAGRRLRGRP
jgi:glycerophosphoryl diester phosphodiesterase